MNAPTSNLLLDAALAYAARGWPVFPCCPAKKSPLTSKESAPGAKDGGLHLATTDEKTIRAWWKKWPKAMIGVPTGERTGNVIDLDLGDPQLISGPDYLERLRQHVGGIPDTAIADTGSGGFHLWFAWQPDAPVNNGANVVPALFIPPAEGTTAANGKTAKGAQIDLRGEGGYVIVPPSVRSDGRAYSWCPEPWDGISEPTDALRRILTKEETKEAKAAASREKWAKRATDASAARPAPVPSGDAASAQAIERYADSALKREAESVATAGSGTRNHALNAAAFKLAQLVAAGALSETTVRSTLEGAAERCGLVADDGPRTVEDTINSGFAAGLAKPRDLSDIGAKGRRAHERRERDTAGDRRTGGERPHEVEGEAHNSDIRLARIALEYPLPLMSTPVVFYEIDRGRVMLHKEVPGKKGGAAFSVPIATPFGATARLRHEDADGAYGLRVAIQDMSGRPRYIDIERADLARQGGAPVRERLFAEGMKAEDDGEHVAIRLLKAASPEIEITVVSRPGWHTGEAFPRPIFVGPDGDIIGAEDDSTLELTKRVRLAPGAARAGDIDGWKAAVAAALDLEACEHWTLGACAAFVGPLLSLAGLSSCGINLSGLSSSGKSTAQRIAVSAWSTPDIREAGLANSAKSTVNAMEAMAARANGTVLSLDEMAHVSGQEVAKMIYTLSGGVGKSRMTVEAEMRGPHRWSTFVLLSSECSLEEKVRNDRGDWVAGMAARFADVDVTTVNRSVPRDTLDRINAIGEHYGHAGPAFVRALMREGIHNDPVDLRERINAQAKKIAGDGADSSRQRAAIPFALLQAAGLMAKRYGLFPAECSIEGSIAWAWGRFMLSSDARALDPAEQVVANIRSFLISRWGVTVRHVGAGGGAQKAEAWFDDSFVYILRENLRLAANNVMTEEGTAQVLNDRGFIAKTEKDRSGLYVRYVPKTGKVSAYVLPRSEFGREEDPVSGYPSGRGAGM